MTFLDGAELDFGVGRLRIIGTTTPRLPRLTGTTSTIGSAVGSSSTLYGLI